MLEQENDIESYIKSTCEAISGECVYLCKNDVYVKLCGAAHGFDNEQYWYRRLNKLDVDDPVYNMFLHPRVSPSILIFRPHSHLVSIGKLVQEGATLELRESILKKLTKMLHILHRRHIYHNDIHTENVLYDTETQSIYLIDLEKMSKVDMGDMGNLEELREQVIDPI